MKDTLKNKKHETLVIMSKADVFFYDKKDLKTALKLYDEVLKEYSIFSDKNLAYIYRNRGNCLQTFNYDYEAINDFNKSIDLDSSIWLTYFLRSLSFGAILKIKEKKEDLLKALDLLRVDSEENRKMKEDYVNSGMDNPEDLVLGRLNIIECDLKSDDDHYEFLAKINDPKIIKQICEIRHNGFMNRLDRVKIRGIK